METSMCAEKLKSPSPFFKRGDCWEILDQNVFCLAGKIIHVWFSAWPCLSTGYSHIFGWLTHATWKSNGFIRHFPTQQDRASPNSHWTVFRTSCSLKIQRISMWAIPKFSVHSHGSRISQVARTFASCLHQKKNTGPEAQRPDREGQLERRSNMPCIAMHCYAPQKMSNPWKTKQKSELGCKTM